MKQKNSKIYWLVFVGVILLLAVIVFCIWLPYKNKTKAPASNKNSNTNISTNNANSNISNSNTNQSLQRSIDQYSQAIIADPGNVQNYIDKSEAEYQSGNKASALQTVNEGLVVNPNNELLRSRKDVLEKDYLNNSNTNNTRE